MLDVNYNRCASSLSVNSTLYPKDTESSGEERLTKGEEKFASVDDAEHNHNLHLLLLRLLPSRELWVSPAAHEPASSTTRNTNIRFLSVDGPPMIHKQGHPGDT